MGRALKRVVHLKLIVMQKTMKWIRIAAAVLPIIIMLWARQKESMLIRENKDWLGPIT